MTNIYFIAPIVIWLALCGPFIINADQLSALFTILLLMGALPYAILWIIAARFPDKVKYCKYVSIAIVIITVIVGIRYLYFSRSEEQAIGIIFLPTIIIGIILFIILLVPFALLIVHMRRRFKIKISSVLKP